MLSFPPKYIVIITVYKQLLKLEKSSRRNEVGAHEVSILCQRTLYDKEHDHD